VALGEAPSFDVVGSIVIFLSPVNSAGTRVGEAQLVGADALSGQLGGVAHQTRIARSTTTISAMSRTAITAGVTVPTQSKPAAATAGGSGTVTDMP
jgi:hypothetical protein